MEMRFFRKIEDTRKNKMWNQTFSYKLNIVSVETTIEQGQLRRLGYMIRSEENKLV